VERHLYQSSTGGLTICPLEQQCQMRFGSATPRLAEMVSFKLASQTAREVEDDFAKCHGVLLSDTYLRELGDHVGRLARDRVGGWQLDGPPLSALYESAAVLAFPSLYEGFGLPLLEAMARGVPAVVGAAGALPELALAAALPVRADDPTAIAAALELLLSDPALRARLGVEGRRRAATFTWEAAAAQTLAVLRRIGEPARRKVA